MKLVEDCDTGRRFLDRFRRTIFRCAVSFIRHCLKTNFFIPEKHALAFRMDPGYLDELGEQFTSDLPDRPFRITFFFGETDPATISVFGYRTRRLAYPDRRGATTISPA